MTDSGDGHRAVRKNGKDSHQDREISALRDRLDKNDADHGHILVKLNDLLTERRVISKAIGAVCVVLIMGVGWFVAMTLEHIHSGERWGGEMRHDIDQNRDEIRDLRRTKRQE